jgi:hypothetical protein
MPATYEPIASHTLTADTASYTLSSIPGTYTDLILVAAHGTSAPSASGFIVRLNGDTASNYSLTAIEGNGSSANSGRNSNVTYLAAGISNASSNAVTVMHFMSYANTSVFKTMLAAADASQYGATRRVGLYRSTSAITSVFVAESNGSFVLKAGSTFSLYGIKAA